MCRIFLNGAKKVKKSANYRNGAPSFSNGLHSTVQVSLWIFSISAFPFGLDSDPSITDWLLLPTACSVFSMIQHLPC